MKTKYFSFIVLLVTLCSCTKAELPETVGSDMIIMCEFDNSKHTYHFTAKLNEGDETTIFKRGFVVGKTSNLKSAQDYTDIQNIEGGFECWKNEDNWDSGEYYVSAFVVTQYGRFHSAVKQIK